MGWDFSHRPKDMTNLEFFRKEFGAGVLDAASPSPAVTYIAYQPRDSDDVVAIVCLTKWVHNDPKFNFGYKDMTESMGPWECDCPKRILDMLTPTDNEWANEWRAKARAKLETKAKRPRLSVGMVLEFDPPLVFPSGHVISQLEVVKLKPNRMKHPGSRGDYLYRIRPSDLDQATVVAKRDNATFVKT